MGKLLVWDRSTAHRGQDVREALKRTRIHEHKLPPYSPEMGAAEYWIRWEKEALSVNYCWPDRASLVRSFNGFVATMSKRTNEVLSKDLSLICMVFAVYDYSVER